MRAHQQFHRLIDLVSRFLPDSTRSSLQRYTNSQLGKRMISGAFWSLLGASISRGMMLLASFFIARILKIEVYGQFSITRSTLNMFLVFAGFGLGLTATKHIAEFYKIDPDRAGRVLALSGVSAFILGVMASVVLFFFSPWLALHALNAPDLAGDIRLGVIFLFFATLNGAQIGALVGFEAFKTIAFINALIGVLAFPIQILGAVWGGKSGSIWALNIYMCLNWICHHIALRRVSSKNKVPFTFSGFLREMGLLWRFTIPAAISSMMVGPVFWYCNSILVRHSKGFSEMAIYDAAYQWHVAVMFIPSMVGRIVLPILSDLHGRGEHTAYKKVFDVNILMNGVVTFAIVLPIAILAKTIMRGYGPGFDRGFWALVFLMISSILVSLNNVIGQLIISKSRMWVGLAINLFWATYFIGFSYFLVSKGFGAVGLALAHLVSYLLHSILQFTYIKKYLLSANTLLEQ